MCAHHHHHRWCLCSVLVTLSRVLFLAVICPPRAGHFSQRHSLHSLRTCNTLVLIFRNRTEKSLLFLLLQMASLSWLTDCRHRCTGVRTLCPDATFHFPFPPSYALRTGQVASLCCLDTTMACRERKHDDDVDDDDENWRNHSSTVLNCCSIIAVVSWAIGLMFHRHWTL